MFKNNRAQYILDGTVCRGLGGPVYCGKEFNFPADLPAQFARILHLSLRLLFFTTPDIIEFQALFFLSHTILHTEIGNNSFSYIIASIFR
jgi:hypothetical protein